METQFTLTSDTGKRLRSVTVTVDGSCCPNPGHGGYAAVLRCGTEYKEIFGGETNTTNNRQELMAVIAAFRALKFPCRVTVRSDSMIVVHLLNGTGKKAHKRANQDLVREVLRVTQPHQVNAVWVRGHAGDVDNERCDYLAKRARPNAEAGRVTGSAPANRAQTEAGISMPAPGATDGIADLIELTRGATA